MASTQQTEPPVLASAEQPIEAATYDDTDSTYGGDDAASYTTSLRSSVLAYKTENNRRYHAYKDGAYLLPNDEKELERLDMMHEMQKILMSNLLYTAPLKSENLKRVLDLGTGTGIWAIEMGDEHPEVEILGTDLSPIQPTMVPPNVKFEVDDMEQPWTFSQKFSYIRVSYLVTALNDHKAVIERAYDNLEPGGWIEAIDYDLTYHCDDGSLKDDNPIQKWIGLSRLSLEKMGRSGLIGSNLEGWVKDAGFTNVRTVRKKLPLGPWPLDKDLKRLGAWNLCQMLEGLEGFVMALFTRILGWEPAEVQALLAQVRTNMENPRIHSYIPFFNVIGQKPLESDKAPADTTNSTAAAMATTTPAAGTAGTAGTGTTAATAATATPATTTTATTTAAVAPSTVKPTAAEHKA